MELLQQDGYAEFSEDQAIQNINTFTSQKLTDIIVMYRYLGLYSNLSTAAMQELSHRREQGQEFDYEGEITAQLNQLPKFNIELPKIDLNALLGNLKKIR